MAPKPPPKPPPPKNFFERFGDYLDSDRGKKHTTVLVSLSFILAVVMFYLYKHELNKGLNLKIAVASIRQFAVEYDASLQDKTDMEVLAAVHHFTLELLNWTLKNEELDKELKILTEMLPGWQAFQKNLYYFSNIRKDWKASRADCLARHTADLVSCRYGEEQGYLDKVANANKQDFWIGLRKNDSAHNGLLWLAGYGAGTTYWSDGQPNGGRDSGCVAVVPQCTIKKCWQDASCSDLRFFSCKMMPKSIWFY